MFGPERDLEMLKGVVFADKMQDPAFERDALALVYFHSHLLFSQVNPEWSIQGCSFSQRGNMAMLVVKGMHEDTPYVAYVTDKTTTLCVRIFARQWLEGRVKWHKDKFR